MALPQDDSATASRLAGAGFGHPPRYLLDLANLSWGLPVLNVAARLNIPDLLAQGVDDIDSLAVATASHAASLARLMRALQSLGICSAAPDGRFVLSENGRFLLENTPGSIRGEVMFAGDSLWKQFGDLLDVVRTGRPSSSTTFGTDGFERLNEDPVARHAFHLSMVASSVAAVRDALDVHDFGRYGRVLDVGGGYGGVLAVLLRAFGGLRGDVFDLAYLADGAAAHLEKAGVADRGGFRAGDFFAALPAGYDCYFLKFVVHDWDDARASAILRNCAKVAAGGATVLLLELVLPDRIEQDPVHQTLVCSDLTMLTIGGRERTAREYRELLAGAGLALRRMTPTRKGFVLIEAGCA